MPAQRWQNARLPADGHNISLACCHELFPLLALVYVSVHKHTMSKHLETNPDSNVHVHVQGAKRSSAAFRA